MTTVCVTGGIGSGKTVVCEIFKRLGVPVFNADHEAKKCYEKPEVLSAIKKKFGEKFITGGKLDRKLLAALVFSDKQALAAVNALIHPLVLRQFDEWRSRMGAARYVIKEAAILFESGSYRDCDRIITVVAPEELRISRIVQRDKRSREEVRNIIENQWSDDEKARRSTWLVTNDETEMLIPQVLKIHKQLAIDK